jgi:hypothetical protein
MIVSRRVPSNRGLAAVEIIQQNFGVKVMEQRAIRCSIRSSLSLVDRTPVGLDPAQVRHAFHAADQATLIYRQNREFCISG